MPRDFFLRDIYEQVILASVLPGVAGAMNASGFFVIGVYTSHMTGLVARAGDEIARDNFHFAGQVLFFVLAFYVGAFISGAAVEAARERGRGRHLLPLLLEAIALALFALDTRAADAARVHHFMLPGILLCIAMGLQNALVTKISGAVVRTTHLTGVVTDLALETFHVLRKGRRGFSTLRDDPEWARLRIHLAIFVSFFSGAIVGPVLYLHVGAASMLLPVVVLLALAVFDVSHGIAAR